MTWLKLSDDFGEDCARARLSDAAFRTHVEGLVWAMRRETDGYVDDIDVRRFAETSDPKAAVQELVNAGFWRALPNGSLQIIHAMEHQPEADVIAARRKKTAERVRRHRRKAAGLAAVEDEEDTGNGVTSPVSERVTRVGAGRVGSGRAQRQGAPTEDTNGASSGATQAWSPVRKPGSGWPVGTVGDEMNEPA